MSERTAILTDGRSGPGGKDESLPPGPTGRRSALVATGAGLLLIASITAYVSFGALPIAPGTVWRIVAHHLFSPRSARGWTTIQDDVVWQLRMPRALLAALVGAGLSITGVAAQALVRNPLADPYVLGISQGASVGAALVIVAGVAGFGGLSTGGAAFVGALGAFVLLYMLAWRGGGLAPVRLVLGGVAVGYALSGVTSFLILRANDPGARDQVIFWLLGSLAKANWQSLGMPAAVLIVGLLLMTGQARALNALLAGDETAASLGVRPDRTRTILFGLVALVTGVMVALSGGIGFVGLVVPHGTRLVVGSDHRRLLPVAAVAGATFLVVADLLARVALLPEELPLGIVTAFVGAPVLLWLIQRNARGGTGL